MNYLKERSPGLIAKGYENHLLAIKPKTKDPLEGKTPEGEKRWWHSRKGGKGWEAAMGDSQPYGVGIITGEIVCVDVDVTDAMMAEAVLQHLEVKFGKNVRRRIGRAPKFAVFFRTDAPFRKITSSGWTSEEDQEKPHRLEILGDGQYSVLYGIHPDTGQEYTWPDGEMPRKEDLPLLTKAQAEELLQWFDEAAQDQGWKKKKGSGSKPRKEAEDDELAMPEPPLGEPEKIKEALAELSAEDYHDWIKYGQAIHHEFGGSEEGFQIFHTWSREASTYKSEEDCRKHWRSFDALKPNGITGRTILADAAKARREREAGIEGTLAWMEENFIYVAETDQTVWIGEHGAHTRQPYSRKNFLEAFSGYTAPALTDRGRPTIKRVVDLWRKSPRKKVAHSAIYQPGKPEVFKEDGVYWLNTFRFPAYEPVEDAASLSVFREHMDYLIPDDIDRRWFIGWMAFTLRYPEHRATVVPLLISRAHGTGRGWVLRLIRLLVGDWNVSTVSLEEFATGKYDGFLSGVKVCAIEESHDSSHKYEVSDKIRAKIDSPRMEINRKYGAKREENIYANVLIFSNRMDALAIGEEDRRIYVIRGPDYRREPEYYVRLYDALDNPRFVAAVRTFLMRFDLTGLDFRNPRDNEARRWLIANSRSISEKVFWEVMKDPPFAAMRAKDFVRHCELMAVEFGYEASDIRDTEIKKLLDLQGFNEYQLDVDGKNIRVRGLIPEAHGGTKESKKLAREALRGYLNTVNEPSFH